MSPFHLQERIIAKSSISVSALYRRRIVYSIFCRQTGLASCSTRWRVVPYRPHRGFSETTGSARRSRIATSVPTIDFLYYPGTTVHQLKRLPGGDLTGEADTRSTRVP